MADKTAKDRRGLMATLVVTLLLTLMGAGAGFAVGVLLQPDIKPGKTAGTEQAAPIQPPAEGQPDGKENEQAAIGSSATGEDDMSGALKVIAFPPVVTTLAAPQGKWIRLEGSVLVAAGGGTAPDLLAEQSGEHILSYLRSVRLEQVEGPSGLAALRDDLRETLVTLSRGEVRGILIHGLIVE